MRSHHIGLRVTAALIGAFFVLPFAGPTLSYLEAAESSSSLRRKIRGLDDDIVKEFRVPILLGVKPTDIADTWGDARSNGREHEGTDIFAPRGAFIVSPTEAVVTSIGVGSRGGNYVYTTNPGGERYYYAHLDEYAKGLSVGDVLEPGDLIGYVGNTGNATNTPPHLHFGIYKRGAKNPFPRLSMEFSLEERMEALDKIIKAEEDRDDREELIAGLAAQRRPLFLQAQAEKIDLPFGIAQVLGTPAVTTAAAVGARDLEVGDVGTDVTLLQQALIKANMGPSARALAVNGVSTYFGPLTQAALAEYQRAMGITPAAGYFGPTTRARLQFTAATAGL